MDNKLRKINKLLKKIITISLFLLAISLSYAYFTAQITGSESTTTITVSGGTMTIAFNGGSNITMSNMYPRAALWGTKTFTVTGNNTTDLTMYYNLTLVITTNTFTSGALKYSLTSINTGSNGTVVPSATMQDIGTGTSSKLLGNGTFTGPTNGDKVHTYTLDFYFPDTGVNQNENHKKSFTAYVKIEEGIWVCNDCLNTKLLAQFGGASNITTAPAGTFNNDSGSTDNLMYKMNDDYGTSYYFRGAKNYVKNNLIFAEHQWKILRINGNGSIRIIYNGTCPNNSCTINSTGNSTSMLYDTYFNPNYNDAKYVGYMYSPSSTTASTSAAQAVTNVTNSDIKDHLDSWYYSYIIIGGYEDYISDTLFCNDRLIYGGSGYGSDETWYQPYYRLSYSTVAPNLNCSQQNDRFTVSDTTIGNGDLTYQIGLITADEVLIAGMGSGGGTTHYLFNGNKYWTMTPKWVHYNSTYLYVIDDGQGTLREEWPNTGWSVGIRGVLNLNSDITATGTGTTSDPYVVQ